MTNANDTAFPIFETGGAGFSKREYFAAMAMQGFLSNPNINASEYNSEVIAEASIGMSDFLIEKLNENQ